MLYGPFWSINVCHLVAQEYVESESNSPGGPPSSIFVLNIK